MAALKQISLAFFLLAVLSFSGTIVQAQSDDPIPLELMTPATGQIEPGGQQRWTFNAPSGALRSFQVEALNGDLDPAFSIINSSGNELIGNDDYDYPNSHDSLLEAITLPRTDTYLLTVSGVNQTSGEYRLTMTAGFAVGSVQNLGNSSNWQTTNPDLTITQADTTLSFLLSGADQIGTAFLPGSDTSMEYYVQVNVNVKGENGWIVGLTARQHQGDTYYLLKINEAGEWQFLVRNNGSDSILRDWNIHPAIVVDNGSFSLGMQVSGTSFDFFYNGQFFGHVNDSTLTDTGQIGLAVGTRSSLSGKTEAKFDSLTLSTPLTVDGKRVIPQQLILSKPSDMAQELQRRGLIPSGGEMALTVNESFIESRRPGVDKLLLGRGTTYANFALGTTLTLQATSQGITGCGLVFRSTDDTHYTLAYIDQTGSYGISQRDSDSFKPGIFLEGKAIEGSTHQLLVIAQDTQVFYYVDGYYSGVQENPTVDGSVGNAVVNFEPINTSCKFNETWVWKW